MPQYPIFILMLASWLVFQVNCQDRFSCGKDFCAKTSASCRKLKCDEEYGRVIKNATACGCCDICIRKLKEGDKCKINEIASTPESECGHGLQCSKENATCVPMETECINQQRTFRILEVNVKVKIIKQKPQCDYFGHYKPVVCIPGVLCYCVDKQGKRIFGTDLASNNASMNCDCSRDFEEFPKKSIEEVANGNFPRCLPNGNYDPLQCTEDWCFCIDSDARHYDDVVKTNTSIKDLACYDETFHKYDDSFKRSKCWHERESILEKLKEYEEQSITVIGVDLPRCELDGNYAPVQCKKNKCYCVRRSGLRYEGYEVNRYTKNAESMTCRCLRDLDMLYKSESNSAEIEFFKKYKCDKNTGNYKPNQTIDSESFMVDEMGYQISNVTQVS